MIRNILFLCFFILAFCPAVNATTYYIDYTNGVGSDNNTGTSPTAPWKRHPYMTGFSGTYTHHAGDQFIFKGGVTWPNAVFPMIIPAGGSVSASDYYGPGTGYTGPRPIFDSQGQTVANGNMEIYMPDASYLTLDNIEFKGHYWTGFSVYGNNVTINNGGTGNMGVIISNCYFHGWSHGAIDPIAFDPSNGFDRFNPNFLSNWTAINANTPTPTVSSPSYSFTAKDVGNWIYVQPASPGYWEQGFFQITSVANGAATVAGGMSGTEVVATLTNGIIGIDYQKLPSNMVSGIYNGQDGAQALNSSVYTSASGGFNPMMVGNVLYNVSTGTGPFTVNASEIMSYISPTQVVLNNSLCINAAGNNCSNGKFYVGSNTWNSYVPLITGFDTANPNFINNWTATNANNANTALPITFSSISYSFVSADVGDWIYVQGGTNWVPGLYQIASVSNGVATITPPPTGGIATVANPTGGVASIDYEEMPYPNVPYTPTVISTGVQVADGTQVAGSTTYYQDPTITGVTSFTPAMAGNTLYEISTGTGLFTVGTAEIVKVIDAQHVILDHSLCPSMSGTCSNGKFYVGGTSSDSYSVIVGNSSGVDASNKIVNTTFTDVDVASDSGDVVYGWGTMSNNLVHDVSNGFVGQGTVINGNILYNINHSYDATQHENSIETWSNDHTQYIYDNIIHDSYGYPPIVPWNAATYVYNNVMWNIFYGPALVLDPSYNPTPQKDSLYVWNNTIESDGRNDCIILGSRNAGNMGSVDLENNQCIGGSKVYDFNPNQANTVDTFSANNNILTLSTDLPSDFTSINNATPNLSFMPTSDTSSTVGTGVNLGALCTSCPGLTVSLNGQQRPIMGAWDVGAYQYSSSTGSVLFGDVNGDGQVTIADAEMAAQAAIALVSLTPAQQQAALVSSSTETSPTTYDAFLIAEKAVNLITKFPVQG